MTQHFDVLMFATQLGQLLKHYAAATEDGHGVMEISEAFLHGFNSNAEGKSNLVLPLRLSTEPPPRTAPFRHQPNIAADQAVLFTISEDRISLRPIHKDKPFNGFSNSITLTFPDPHTLHALARHGDRLGERTGIDLRNE